MEQVEAGAPVPIEVSFDSGLDVAMKVYDVTDGSATLVDTVPMDEIAGGAYFALYAFDAEKLYVVRKNAYTDGTFTTLDPDQRGGSESFRTTTIEAEVDAILALVGAGVIADVVAVVEDDGQVAVVNDDDQVVASVKDGG